MEGRKRRKEEREERKEEEERKGRKEEKEGKEGREARKEEKKSKEQRTESKGKLKETKRNIFTFNFEEMQLMIDVDVVVLDEAVDERGQLVHVGLEDGLEIVDGPPGHQVAERLQPQHGAPVPVVAVQQRVDQHVQARRLVGVRVTFETYRKSVRVVRERRPMRQIDFALRKQLMCVIAVARMGHVQRWTTIGGGLLMRLTSR